MWESQVWLCTLEKRCTHFCDAQLFDFFQRQTLCRPIWKTKSWVYSRMTFLLFVVVVLFTSSRDASIWNNNKKFRGPSVGMILGYISINPSAKHVLQKQVGYNAIRLGWVLSCLTKCILIWSCWCLIPNYVGLIKYIPCIQWTFSTRLECTLFILLTLFSLFEKF